MIFSRKSLESTLFLHEQHCSWDIMGAFYAFVNSINSREEQSSLKRGREYIELEEEKLDESSESKE